MSCKKWPLDLKAGKTLFSIIMQSYGHGNVQHMRWSYIKRPSFCAENPASSYFKWLIFG